jgi:hypothetical protein
MRRLLGSLALAALATLGTAGVASAQEHCDTYSGTCVEGTHLTKPAVRPARDVAGVTLPFTGAAITAMLLAGGGAVAGGTVLVAAGRRRRTSS